MRKKVYKNRIRELREEKNLKQAELAEILGIRQNTLSTWETGRYEPDNEMLQRISDYFDVSIDYVLGKNPLRKLPTSEINMGRFIRLTRTVEQMQIPQFDETVAFAESLLAGRHYVAPSAKSIPVLGDVAAGLPMMAEENIVDYEEVDPAMAASGELFGLRIKGSSMEPRIKEGDVVIVRKQEDVDTGDVAVVLVNGDSATVKRIKKETSGITLIPNNPAYDPKYYSNEDIQRLPVTIVGKVVELRGKF